MAFLDNENVTIKGITSKVIWRCEVDGPLEGDCVFTMHVDKVTTQDGLEVARKSVGKFTVDSGLAASDPLLSPHTEKIQNGFKALVRELAKKAKL